MLQSQIQETTGDEAGYDQKEIAMEGDGKYLNLTVKEYIEPYIE